MRNQSDFCTTKWYLSVCNYGPKCYINNQEINRDFFSRRLYKFWRRREIVRKSEGNSYARIYLLDSPRFSESSSVALQPGAGLGLLYNTPPILSIPCSVSPFVYSHLSQVRGHVIQPSNFWSSSLSCCIQLSVHLFWDCGVLQSFYMTKSSYSNQKYCLEIVLVFNFSYRYRVFNFSYLYRVFNFSYRYVRDVGFSRVWPWVTGYFISDLLS